MTQIIKIDNAKKRSGVEVADIMHKHIPDYKQKYRMPRVHSKVINSILNCRTLYFGGHIEECDHCGVVRNVYNSCRNRHCPKCQTLTKEKWIEARKAELLPVLYFHNVFTLPHELNPIILCNKKVMLNILFKAVSATLKQFGENPENGLGGKLGFIAILHTWDQKLLDHFHLHCLVPGGALASDKSAWIPCKNNFLFAEKALAQVFKGKFIDFFEQAKEEGKLIFPGNTEPLGTAGGFKKFVSQLWPKGWVVDIRDPIKRPERVLEYLGRYTHRVAISNNRIVSLKDGKVTFKFKNRKKDTTEETTIDAVEFIRRFLLHTLPSGFMRIRHYGFLANRYKKENLKACRKFLGLYEELPEVVKKSVREMMLELTGKDIKCCRHCGKGTMQIIGEIEGRYGPSLYYVRKPAA